ncbi:hypothetical protein Tco_1539957 [Tanacetum coccineum]
MRLEIVVTFKYGGLQSRAQVDQESQIKMIQVKEMMQDNDLKNSKSKDKGSRSRSQSMNDQSHYKQDKTKNKAKHKRQKSHPQRHRVMDPSSSVGKTCLGENVIEISSEKAEGHGDWNSPEYLDTSNNGGKKETKAMVFHNWIPKRLATDLWRLHEVKRRNKVVKKELIVALRGEIYFVKFIINPEEDDVEPGVPEHNPFLDSVEEEEKIGDDWDLLFDDLDFGNIPDIEAVDVSQFVCKMGKSSRNKRKQLENYKLTYSDIGPSMYTGKPLTREEAEREALAISICERYSLLEEERHVIETMAYSDKYKNILDEICLDKMKLDGMSKEEEEAIIKIKGEALIEKDDPGAFVILIRLEGKINLNALADTGSDINVMPYRVYKELDREEVRNVKKEITMLNHSKAEPMGLLSNVLCQVGVTTIIAKFLILDMPIDRDTPILVGRGFLHTCGGILNTIDSITSTFDGNYHQTFRAAKTSLNTAESDSDDEEEYAFQKNKFGAPIYGPKPARYLNCSDPLDQSLALQEVLNPFRKICVWKKVVGFLGSLPVALQHCNIR